MKIGLIGPPEVGKTKVARALGKRFGLKVVDNYVQRLQKSSGLALGPWSSYSEHFMVMGVRMAEEHKAGDKRITVGTQLDTLTYAALHSDVVLNRSRQALQDAYDAAQTAMKALSLVFGESWDNHFTFHLPYSPEQREAKGQVWQVSLDSAYESILETFPVPHVYTVQGTTEERINLITEVLELAQAEPPTEETPTPPFNE